MLLTRTMPRLTDQPSNIPWRSSTLPLILLASKSPRRRLLLDQAGLDHEVIESGVDDGQLVSGSVTPEQWVAALAYLKAAAALNRLPLRGPANPPSARPQVILGADTVVVDDDRIIGQPRDRADAERILRILIDGEHEVLTGVALIDPLTGRREMFTDRSDVTVGNISDAALGEYLDSGEWRGKAGAYNLSERLHAGWPITFTGDPGTIMGLPIEALVPRLAAFGRS